MLLRFLTTGCLVGLLFVAYNGIALGDGSATKENLDLPYNALGEGDEEELAPAIISFYGGTYEANSVVFCLDYSKSMRHGHREIQTREIFKSIRDLSSGTKFDIVFYGAGVDLFRPQLVKATKGNKVAALNDVSATPLSLGTCMGPAVRRALTLAKGSARAVVILAGDGKPTTCPHTKGADKAAIRRQILAESATVNPGRSVTIHTIYVGDPSKRTEVEFMRKLSIVHGGTFRVVEVP
jgi:hypothetical protein